MGVWLLILSVLQIVAILIFFSCFFSAKELAVGKSRGSGDMYEYVEGCPDVLAKIHSKIVSKLVMVVIDAWQERFFYNRETMYYLRHLTLNGKAVAFTAHVQTPTVTMPRIKAITAGIVPSFIDIAMNFASTSISTDNIIDQLKNKGYRCTFCGDETWLRLFPGRFDNYSMGTTSFYVNDYKEVDDNVTHCMNARFENNSVETWDVMVLHYLGLDHIGHSLGGAHSELDIKLTEMDFVIKEIYEKLNKIYGTNFSIIVFGDHGMTEAGSHGGSSVLETYVPVVYVDGKKRHVIKEVVPKALIEQVDIVPTVASLFNLPIPKENLGVTFMSHIAASRANPSVLLSVLRNAEQFQEFDSSNMLDRCVNRFRNLLQKYCTRHSFPSDEKIIRECIRVLRKVQSQRMYLQSNVNSGEILASIILSFTISSICVYTAYRTYPCIVSTGIQDRHLSTYLAFFVQTLHLASLFASSLVEEEHDLHYFFFTSCLFVMLLEELRPWLAGNIARNVRVHPQSHSKSAKMITLVFLLVAHRFCRGYIESSRRRWIMEKDVTYSNETILLDNSGIITNTAGSRYAPDISTILKESSVLQFIFGISSLIVIGIRLSSNYSDRKKHFVLTCFLMSLATVAVGLRHYTAHNRIGLILMFLSNMALLLLFRDFSLNLIVWALFIMRTHNLLLAVLQLLLGHCLALVDAQPFVLILAIFSSFFYWGNSNNLSTIDIAVGYTCVEKYQPAQIAMQILLNTYIGPLLVLSSWWRTLASKSTDLDFLSLKLSSLLCSVCSVIHSRMSFCLLSFYIHRYHLFVWSVFAPKLLYEFAHLVVLTVIIMRIIFTI